MSHGMPRVERLRAPVISNRPFWRWMKIGNKDDGKEKRRGGEGADGLSAHLCLISAPFTAYRISCRSRCEANHIFPLSRTWLAFMLPVFLCLDWVWECVILKRECLWVEQINLWLRAKTIRLCFIPNFSKN